jgi:hypothetical protein
MSGTVGIGDNNPWPSPATHAALDGLGVLSADKITIRYERSGRCFWHIGCKAQRHAPPMSIGEDSAEKRRTLIRCTACEDAGYYPHGSVGDVCCERVVAEAPIDLTNPLAILRELVALKRLHDKIEAAEAKGIENFVDDVPLYAAKDDYERRKAIAWGVAFNLVDGAASDQHRIVPIDPTEEMIQAGAAHVSRLEDIDPELEDEVRNERYRSRGCAIAMFKDMVAAANGAPHG